MTNNLKAVVYGRLEAIMNAEKITRAELGHLSREALIYVPETDDIDLVNRLIGVLTPMNKQMAILFFKAHLPWEVENNAKDEFVRFGKRMKQGKKFARRMKALEEFLKDEDATIWTWAEVNVEIEQKQVNMAVEFEQALTKALQGYDTKTKHAEPLSKAKIAEIVLGKISFEEMFDAIDKAKSTLAEMETHSEEPMKEQD